MLIPVFLVFLFWKAFTGAEVRIGCVHTWNLIKRIYTQVTGVHWRARGRFTRKCFSEDFDFGCGCLCGSQT